MNDNEPIKVLELFGGIGAIRKAFERQKIPHKVVDFVEIDEFAVKSYNAIYGTNFEPQDISKWDKDIDVDFIMHGSPCFVAGTKVLTNNGYKDIEDITIGDSVLTHTNSFKKVIDFGSDGKKPIFKLEAQGILPIECTANHPFYVKHRTKIWNNSKRSYEFIYNKPEKIRLSSLQSNNDYIGIPIIPDMETKFNNISNETLWLLGRYVADGHIDNKTNMKVILSIGKSKINQFDTIYMEHKTYLHTKSCYRIIFNKDSELYKIVDSGLFGFGASSKKIPLEILQLPVTKLKIFLDGYMSGDGCNIKNTSTYQATTISRELAESLVLAVQKVHKVGCKIYYTKRPKKCIIEGRIVNQHDTYMIRYNLAPQKPHYIVDNVCIWYPIKKITNMKIDKTIYNITVEDDHTYTANNCYTFNCQDFSIAGLQKGGDEGSGTRSSLMYETIRLVKKLNPKYVIWENVKNLISDKHYHNFNKYLKTMESLNYHNYYQVLNAKDYGIPQNRERVFTVSIRKDIDEKNFYFPDAKPLTLRLKDLLEDNVDEKYYLSDDKINAISHWNSYQNPLERVMGNNSIANTLTAREGGTDHAGMLTYSNNFNNTTDVLNNVITHKVEQNVKVRKYQVDTEKLVELLIKYKELSNLSCSDIASKLNVPTTKVEHWFRKDNSFAIPDCDIWLNLKNVLGIETTEFDESIMTFEIKPNKFESTNRVYDENGIAPTLDTSDDKKIIEYKGKEVELPTMCSSRGRKLNNPNDRTASQKLQQTIEVNIEGVSNCLTTVEKDNYVLEEDMRDVKIEVLGNYKPSGHSCGRIIDPNGITPTVMENHGAVTAIVEPTKELKYVGSIRDKDIVGDGKQNLSRNASVGDRVYDSNGVSTTITAEGGGVGGHSGLYTVDDIVKRIGNYTPSGHNACDIIDPDGISPTVMYNHGSVTSIVENNNNLTEPQVLKYERTEFGKQVRKDYENGNINLHRDEMRELVPRNDGISNTITTVTKDNYVVEPVDIDNPLKGISGQSWQFEQNVYSEDSKLIRTIKAGEGSGNIPKIIENTNSQTFIPTHTNSDEIGYIKKGKNGTQHQSNTVYDENGVARTLNACDYKSPMMIMTKQEIVDTINKNAKHQHELVNNEDGIARTLVAGTHGNANCHTKTVVEDNRNMKEQLCDYLVENNMVEPYDVINHGYTDHRFESIEQGKDIVMSKNIAPTITTRPDELGVTVESNKSLFTDSDKKMITDDGNIKRYINSDIVDEFKEGQIADISFPNGYNKGSRVHNECPTINGTTIQSFITKESNDNHFEIKNATAQGYLNAYEGDGVNLSGRMKYQRGNVQPQMTQTITTSGGNDRGVVVNNTKLRIRKLTPKECWRLMGFDDEDFDRAEKVNSNAQLYKQAGNSIVVNVLEAIINSLFRPDPNLPKRKFAKKLF